jgi:hypothetical protein
MSTTEIPDLIQRGTVGPVTYYADPDALDRYALWIRVIRCGGEFRVTVFRLDLELRAFDYLPREAVPDGPLDAATVTQLAREALGGQA